MKEKLKVKKNKQRYKQFLLTERTFNQKPKVKKLPIRQRKKSRLCSGIERLKRIG